MAFFTYLLASAPYGTLYCGHTDNLLTRVYQHREKSLGGFTAKYGVSRLVWFELHDTREAAYRQEQRVKKWNRDWKIRMIEATNADWSDLYDGLIGPQLSGDAWAGLLAAGLTREQVEDEARRLAQLGSPPSRGRADV